MIPVARWEVERRDDRVFVTGKLERTRRPMAHEPARDHPRRIVIVGGGAAGFAAAEMLRRRGYEGAITMLSADDAPPYDRPNLSKDYLAGSAPEEWIPLRPESSTRSTHRPAALERRCRHRHASRARSPRTEELAFDRLLLATGAEPVRLDVPGRRPSRTSTLRSLADSRAIIARARSAKRAVVIGASFIGLEVAASLRTRGLEVHVVAPERGPRARAGARSSATSSARCTRSTASSSTSAERRSRIEVATRSPSRTAAARRRPRRRRHRRAAADELAERAGLAVDRGVVVDEYLETSAPGVFAAGDIARWPDPRSGERIRVEHWVVAERQGQTAARNMLGGREPFTAVPFFWSRHYDVSINYVGHARLGTPRDRGEHRPVIAS